MGRTRLLRAKGSFDDIALNSEGLISSHQDRMEIAMGWNGSRVSARGRYWFYGKNFIPSLPRVKTVSTKFHYMLLNYWPPCNNRRMDYLYNVYNLRQVWIQCFKSLTMWFDREYLITLNFWYTIEQFPNQRTHDPHFLVCSTFLADESFILVLRW